MSVYEITLLPPIYEEYLEYCKIEKLTALCILKQLNIKTDLFAVIVNNKIVTNLNAEIKMMDKVVILPLIAGG